MSPKLELAAILLTALLGDQYYRAAGETRTRLEQLATREPHFAARAALYARREFGMRSASHITAAAIARHRPLGQRGNLDQRLLSTDRLSS